MAISANAAVEEDASSASRDSILIRPQSKLGAPGLILLIALSNIIVPCSLDMYTPAVPDLPAYFNTTAATVNLTIVCFFLFYSLGMLAFGPLSDKFGRKPVLVAGMTGYTAGCILCGFAWSVYVLIFFRVVQALGAGAVVSVTTALVKDSFVPSKRDRIIALLQIMQVVGPVAAPLIGGAILLVADWRATFWALAILGAVCLGFAANLEDPVHEDERSGRGVFASIARLGAVAKDPAFDAFLVIISMFNFAFMAYVSTASYVYIDHFGLSQQEYTYFFAVTAGLTALGPLSYLEVSRLLGPKRLVLTFILATMALGLLLTFVGGVNPYLFCALMTFYVVFEGIVRPCGVNLLLSQIDGDVGSASSLINFTQNAFGVVGMSIIMCWNNYVQGIGEVVIIGMAAALVLYFLVTRVGAFKLRALDE